MRYQVWINGRYDPTVNVHVVIVEPETTESAVHLAFYSGEQTSLRVARVTDGDIDTETPVTMARLLHIARHG